MAHPPRRPNNTHTSPLTVLDRPKLSRPAVDLPYFDHLLTLLSNGPVAVEKSFGRHVHWGYWEYPPQSRPTASEFATAAEHLSAKICAAAEIQHGYEVLDVGCGFGGTIAYLNENFRTMRLTGLNLDDRQLKRASSTVASEHDNSVNWVQANACQLPFGKYQFDAVLAVECIFHFPDRAAFFEEARRVLKPGGVLALSDFIPNAGIVPLAKLKLPLSLSRGFYGKCNLHYTLRDYRRLSAKIGFETGAEIDITHNTLPTYPYLRRLASETAFHDGFAIMETATLELLSRLGLIRYFIQTYKKT